MEQNYLIIAFILIILNYLLLLYQKKMDKEDTRKYEVIYKLLMSQNKLSMANFSELGKIKGDFLNVIYSFLSRYENMLYNEHKNYGYMEIYSIRNEKLVNLAESYISKNPSNIYDAISEMTKTVSEKITSQQYYSKKQFVSDLIEISKFLKYGKYRIARKTLSNISKKNTENDIIWITFLLRYGTAELNYNYWPDNKIRKNLALNISKWIDYLAESIDKNDKVSTLKFLDLLYDDIFKLKGEYNVNDFC